MDLALQVRPQPDQRRAVAHPATQLPCRRRRDRGVGQPTHPRQIRQVRGVTLVVLHPLRREHLHPWRIGIEALRVLERRLSDVVTPTSEGDKS
jgi:hypothetical protein